LGIGGDALELTVESTRLAENDWKLLRSEHHEPEDEQENDLAPREIEHVPILKATYARQPFDLRGEG
jgi:hypothetical protein